MPISDEEARQISREAYRLRSGGEYRSAGRILRLRSAAELSSVQRRTDVYAAARFQIGTWDHIARCAKDFSQHQLDEFFRSQPVGFMWSHLQPALAQIRTESGMANYAKDFENLANKYSEWARTPGGEQFTSGRPSVALACFD
jgi:hypothetical protein